MQNEAAGAGHSTVAREDNDRSEADSPVDENDNDASPPRKKRKSNTNRPTTAKEKDEGEKDGFKYCIYDGCHYHSLSQEITLRHIDVCPKMPTKVSTAKGMVTLPLRLTNPPLLSLTTLLSDLNPLLTDKYAAYEVKSSMRNLTDTFDDNMMILAEPRFFPFPSSLRHHQQRAVQPKKQVGVMRWNYPFHVIGLTGVKNKQTVLALHDTSQTSLELKHFTTANLALYSGKAKVSKSIHETPVLYLFIPSPFKPTALPQSPGGKSTTRSTTNTPTRPAPPGRTTPTSTFSSTPGKTPPFLSSHASPTLPNPTNPLLSFCSLLDCVAANRAVIDTPHLTVKNMTDFFSRHIENRAHAQGHGAASLWTYPEASQALATLIQNSKFVGNGNRGGGGNGRNNGGGNSNGGRGGGGNNGRGSGNGYQVKQPPNRSGNKGAVQNKKAWSANEDDNRRQFTSSIGNRTLCMNWNKGLNCGGEVHAKDLWCTKPDTNDDR